MEQGTKRGKKPDESERKLLLKCKDFLNKEIALRNVEFNEAEQKAMSPLQFLSTKPEVFLLNIGERNLNTDNIKELQSSLSIRFPSLSVITLCGKIEAEIAQLSPDEARPFLDDMGIEEPALNKLIRICYDILGLISFFTYVGDEVRAWTITKGTNALKAAGTTHTDIERWLIKAVVVSAENFM